MADIALPQIDSPFQAQSKALQLNQLMQAGQDQAYQQQQRVQAQADDASYRTALRANPDGGVGLLKDLARTGSPKDYAAAVKADLEARKGAGTIASNEATTKKTQFDTIVNANKMVGSAAGVIKATPTFENATAVVGQLKQNLGPELSQHLGLDTLEIPRDPQALAQWADQHYLASIDTGKQLDDARVRSEGNLNRQVQTDNSIRTDSRIKSEGVANRDASEERANITLTHGMAGLSDVENTALSTSIKAGFLDPNKVNGRTAKLYASLILKDPTTDFNKHGADSALMRNAAFQQKVMVAATLPEVMTNMVTAGKAIGFSDNRTIGKMQGWVKGEFNDPAMTEYMTQRNDALMSIAGVMRGTGMTDMAHKAETEVSSPTMSPAALDAWMKGQMKSLEPRLRNNSRIMHTPVPGAPGAAPVGAPGAVALPGAGTGSSAPAAGAGGRPSIDSFFLQK